jgi:hypothetical protein
MAETQRGLGGVGQREAGAYPHTLVIWDYVNEHPGVTRDELKSKALELDWIARGYAHRWYAAERNRVAGKNARSGLACVSVAEVAATRSDRAVRAVVSRVLQVQTRDGSLRRDESAGYHAVRRPKATAQVQARVRPRDEVMAGIVLAEVRRKLLAFGIDRLEQPHAKLPLDVRVLLAKWLRASQLVEQPGSDCTD